MPNRTLYWSDHVTLRETLVDNGDGTGILVTYDTDGNELVTERLSDLPIPKERELTETERLEEIEEVTATLLGKTREEFKGMTREERKTEAQGVRDSAKGKGGGRQP